MSSTKASVLHAHTVVCSVLGLVGGVDTISISSIKGTTRNAETARSAL